jgi:hypothetical protein
MYRWECGSRSFGNLETNDMLINSLSQKEEGYGSQAGDAAFLQHGSESSTNEGKSKGTASDSWTASAVGDGRALEFNGGYQDETEPWTHIDQPLEYERESHRSNESQEQVYSDTISEQSLNGTSQSSAIQNGHQYPVVSPGTNLHNQVPELTDQPANAHVTSIPRVGNESFRIPRPAYVRALSSEMPESVAPSMTPEEAHAEILRRLGRATRTMRTMKRRGSNESLSSLISYSIRRPSMPSRPESGYSLDALAHVLENAAQEGNLALVQAAMALGADPNFRSVNRLKNRRHDALNKATTAGHVEIIDYLLRQGTTYNLDATPKSDPFTPIDYKLLDAAYLGHIAVARYLIANQGANPRTSQWPRAYFDATRTIYRRVTSAHVSQRTILSGISKTMTPELAMPLLHLILHDPSFDPTAPTTLIYTDTPYTNSTSRMTQTTSHYSALSLFVKAGWFDAVRTILDINADPSAYEKQDICDEEEGQIPSTCIQRFIWPANTLTRDTWITRPGDAVKILKLLVKKGFDVECKQQTPDDSAPRSPLGRAILANAADGVEVLVKARPELVREDVSFRVRLASGQDREYVAKPLAASILLGNLENARVLLRYGASVYEEAFGYKNVVLYAAAQGASGILGDLIALAPEMMGEALQVAIEKFRIDAVAVLLEANANEDIQRGLWDVVLGCKDTSRDDDVESRYIRILEMVYEESSETDKPSSETLRKAVEGDNIVGVEKCVAWGLVERNEVGKWCQAMMKGTKWSEMLERCEKY